MSEHFSSLFLDITARRFLCVWIQFTLDVLYDHTYCTTQMSLDKISPQKSDLMPQIFYNKYSLAKASHLWELIAKHKLTSLQRNLVSSQRPLLWWKSSPLYQQWIYRMCPSSELSIYLWWIFCFARIRYSLLDYIRNGYIRCTLHKSSWYICSMYLLCPDKIYLFNDQSPAGLEVG